jgi:hypothetical protein
MSGAQTKTLLPEQQRELNNSALTFWGTGPPEPPKLNISPLPAQPRPL